MDHHRRDHVRQAKILIKELVVAKGRAIKEEKEKTAIQRRQGTLDLQPWDGKMTGWTTFKVTAEKI